MLQYVAPLLTGELIQTWGRKEKRLHGLINNAGIMATPYEESSDHYEAQFQVRAPSFRY